MEKNAFQSIEQAQLNQLTGGYAPFSGDYYLGEQAETTIVVSAPLINRLIPKKWY
jgi:hypothetical protein